MYIFNVCLLVWFCFFFFKQKTAYELRISDWISDVCSSDLHFGFEAEMVVSARHKLRKALEGCRWIGGDHIDRATSRIPSVQRALRTAQDLESLHIEEASKDAGRPLEVDAVEMRGDWKIGRAHV